MTGRAAGFCAGYPVPGYMNGGFGYGRGMGMGGRGRGRRNWFYATGMPGWQRASMGMQAFGGVQPVAPVYGAPPIPAWPPAAAPEQELQALQGQAENLKGILDDIQKRIEELREKAGQE